MKKKKIIAFENTSTAMTYLISILDKTKQKLKVVHLLNSNIEVSETMLRLCWLVIALGFQQRYNHNCSIRYHRTKLFLVNVIFFPSFVQPKKRKRKPIFSSRVNSVDRKKAREIWTQVNRRKELEWTWHFYVCRLLIKTLRFRNERLRERLEGKRIKERLCLKNKITWRRKKENQLVFDVTKSRRWVWASVLE
jgi:hypothetical protein